MKPLRSYRALFAALLLTVAAACSSEQAPLAPPPPPQMSLIGDLFGTVEKLVPPVKGLLSCNVTQSYTTTKRIGTEGGTIQVGPHSLYIPQGALREPQTITATAPRGNVVEVEFQPHGLKFEKPTALTMSYRDCSLLGSLLPRIVYADENRNILEVLLTVPNVWRQTVTAPTDHFSSYLLAE